MLFTAGDKKPRCEPVSQCWSPYGKVYCGCKGGQLLVVDAESSRVTVLNNPEVQQPTDRTQSLSVLRRNTKESIPEKSEGKLWFLLIVCVRLG